MRKVLHDQLKIAQASGKPIVLVSHSLGSVIAFDVWRRLAPTNRIAQWFAVGCPLDHPVIQLARSNRLGNILRIVSCWHNSYDTQDWVARKLTRFKFNNDDHQVETANSMPAPQDDFITAEPRQCYAVVCKGNPR